jgi:hypothetical protein
MKKRLLIGIATAGVLMALFSEPLRPAADSGVYLILEGSSLRPIEVSVASERDAFVTTCESRVCRLPPIVADRVWLTLTDNESLRMLLPDVPIIESPRTEIVVGVDGGPSTPITTELQNYRSTDESLTIVVTPATCVGFEDWAKGLRASVTETADSVLAQVHPPPLTFMPHFVVRHGGASDDRSGFPALNNCRGVSPASLTLKLTGPIGARAVHIRN